MKKIFLAIQVYGCVMAFFKHTVKIGVNPTEKQERALLQSIYHLVKEELKPIINVEVKE